ncbi:hypothetical protein B6U98_03125 [Thermoplasmatales archaeon ex4572_165]|nr:MAG: hypothetical protein B6U98_03125 [Thermoplasmatales archaeon ex4572_165]RLF59607.1 MAG: hypothetical protein DRN27_02160 [Thermoplasmata archaeon]
MSHGYLLDDGTEIDPATVPTPTLCKSCMKNTDAKEETICMLNRIDQLEEIKNNERFCGFSYEPIDPSVNKQQLFDAMEQYLEKKNGQ